jgi:hypothetical protein
MKGTLSLALLFGALAGAAVWLIAGKSVQPALGQGAGIAAKYPGDAGIAKDPAVLFADDFETGTVADIGKRWGSIDPADGKTIALDSDVPAGTAGSRSLQITQTMGQNSGGYLYTTFPGVDKAYLRFYVKFGPDHAYEHHFVELGGYHPPLPYPYPKAGARPEGNDRVLVFVDCLGEYGKYPPPGIWSLYTYWTEMKISADQHYWGNCINPPVPQQIVRGRWQCVEAMVSMNSAPDRADGELALWLDGQQVMDVKKGTPRANWSGMGFDVLERGGVPFEGFRFRTDDALKINHLWLEHYLGQGEQQANKVTHPNPVNRVWFDDVVVAKSYIGPLAK